MKLFALICTSLVIFAAHAGSYDCYSIGKTKHPLRVLISELQTSVDEEGMPFKFREITIKKLRFRRQKITQAISVTKTGTDMEDQVLLRDGDVIMGSIIQANRIGLSKVSTAKN